ncbi:DUF1918 domain-containing protein [Streptosporangium subroseum]|uniref:DUF1918 domain-containing protein n=1 Tax=Streptosporangium subroseum TaxID=106412 RepID=UPI00308BDE38|nr:DUF1918 domain-containing protein [Streptosporangium subroseum]
MKAAVGDELVIESAHEGEARRVGVIVELRNDDGSPPYVVRWLHVEQETLVFPGPDAHVMPKKQEAQFTTEQ